MPIPIPNPYWVALALAAGAALTDARSGHIPNSLTIPAIFLAPVAHLIVSGPIAGAMSVLALLICASVPYLMWRQGAAGGGDVKLLGALGAIGGASFGIETQIFGFGVALLFSLVLLCYRGHLLITLGNALFLLINPLLPGRFRRARPTESMTSIRMGVPFFIGALLCVWLRSGSVA